MNLKALSDDQLLSETSTVVASERRITADAIKHFYEINRRKLHLQLGYGSLFEMLRNKYGYCEATAQLRKNAVYLMQDVPDVIEKIESGVMPVTVAANIQSFLYAEKRLDRAYSPEAKAELIETCIGKSVRDVQKEFARRNPDFEKRESIKQVTEDRVRVSHSISNELEDKLQRIRRLWSHIDPNMSRETMLDRMAELTLDQIDPLRKAKRAENRKVKTATAQTITETSLRAPEVGVTRYIEARHSHEVYLKNADRGCDFVSETSGQRCGSKFQLQRDHIKPLSQGGASTCESIAAPTTDGRGRTARDLKSDLSN